MLGLGLGEAKCGFPNIGGTLVGVPSRGSDSTWGYPILGHAQMFLELKSLYRPRSLEVEIA